MSFHVYVSRPGFKDEPISEAEWLAAARGCTGLSVVEHVNRRGVSHHQVTLVGTQRPLWLTPYGLIHAQDPPAELVEAMFELAATLGAGVYSQRLKRYDSVEDWRLRTRRYRASRAVARESANGQRKLRLILWTVLILASLSAGWLLAEYKTAVTAWFDVRGR
jgi:hypothetical protein